MGHEEHLEQVAECCEDLPGAPLAHSSASPGAVRAGAVSACSLGWGVCLDSGAFSRKRICIGVVHRNKAYFEFSSNFTKLFLLFRGISKPWLLHFVPPALQLLLKDDRSNSSQHTKCRTF